MTQGFVVLVSISMFVWVGNPALGRRGFGDRVAIEQLIERLFDEDQVDDDGDTASEELEPLGADALPALIKALHDPRILTVFGDGSSLDSGPLQRVWELLEPLSDETLVVRLGEISKEGPAPVRNTAAFAIAHIGADAGIPYLLKLLDDPE